MFVVMPPALLISASFYSVSTSVCISRSHRPLVRNGEKLSEDTANIT